jgi:hypothetical protein
MVWQRALAVLLAPYAAWLVFAYEYHFLDGVNLAFHEAGHLFLRFGGQTLHTLGGTIGQLFFPAVLAVRFARREERYEAAVCVLWLGESLMYAATYLGDAQAQALPLVGGHIHDWNWLLGHAGLLAQAESLGRLLHVLASAVVLGAWTWCARAAFAKPDAVREIAPRQPLFRRQP